MSKPKAVRLHLARVRELPCMACGTHGVELHHIREHTGLGKRADDFEVIPLCPVCHRTGDGKAASGFRIGYHFSPKRFTERHGTQRELLHRLQNLLGYEFIRGES